MDIKKLYSWIAAVTIAVLFVFFGILKFFEKKEFAIEITISVAAIILILGSLMLLFENLQKISVVILTSGVVAAINALSAEVIIQKAYPALAIIYTIAIATIVATAIALCNYVDKKHVYCGYAIESFIILGLILI